MRKYSLLIMVLAAVGAGCGKTIVTVPAEVDTAAGSGADAAADSGAGSGTDASSSADTAGDAISGGADAADSSTNPDVLVAVDSADVQDNPTDVAPAVDSGPPKCGSAADCDDKNACTEDKCGPTQGCTNLASSGPCDDKNACTVGDVCANSSCVGGAPALIGSDCDDGKACTTGDACDDKGTCVSNGDSLWVVKDGTELQDIFNRVTVGPDGTVVSVGYSNTGKDTYVARMVGRSQDKSLKFDVKPLPTNSKFNAVTAVKGGAYVAVGHAENMLEGNLQKGAYAGRSQER